MSAVMDRIGPQVRVPVVVLVALILQPVLDMFHILHTHADLLMLLPVLAGLIAGAEAGALVGFLSGLGTDLAASTAFGFYAMVFTVLGALCGMAGEALIRGPWWAAPVAGGLGSAFGVLLVAVFGAVLDQSAIVNTPEFIATVGLVVATFNALLSIPLLFVLRWAFKIDADDVGPGAP